MPQFYHSWRNPAWTCSISSPAVQSLTFISKFLQRLVARRPPIHSELNQLLGLAAYQSAYRPHHSTETVLTCLTNDILCSIDKGNVCALVLLYLSAAFDTVDHELLLNIMSNSFGLSGRVQLWLQSYLSDRTQTISINNQQTTVHVEHLVVRCTTRLGVWAGTIHYVHGRPWRVSQRCRCSTTRQKLFFWIK